MLVVVLAKHQIAQLLVVVDNRQAIELLFPDQLVRLAERNAFHRVDQLRERRHEPADGRAEPRLVNAIIPTRQNPDQLAVRRAVVRNRNGRVPDAPRRRHDVAQRLIRPQVGVARDETRLKFLDLSHHLRLQVDGLRTKDERHAAAARQLNRHRRVGHRLHNGRSERDVETQSGFAGAALDQRRAHVDVLMHALLRREAGDQQIFAERAGRLVIVLRHGRLSVDECCVMVDRAANAAHTPPREMVVRPFVFRRWCSCH